ncbi:MAG: hypothetical protein P1U67_01335 [Alcanivoracaceae bacterium]|nr:hypothetical protein [Alcanivoracaceae bacterium]
MNKLPSKEEMQSLINKEIETMEPGLKEYAISLLVPLKEKVLKWEYGNDKEFPAWEFADFGERNVGAAYCLGGHGAGGDTWGLIFTNDDYFGMDAGWYSSFKEMLTDGWYEQDI